MTAMPMDRERALRVLLRHQVSLVAYMLGILSDEHLAEDLFQDMAVMVLQGDCRLPEEDYFLAWAHTVARNRALNAIRSTRRKGVHLDEDVIDLLETQFDRHDRDDQAALIDALRQCVAKLGEKARRLLNWRYRDDSTCITIAERTHKPLNTVYVTLSRIQRSLAACVRQRLTSES